MHLHNSPEFKSILNRMYTNLDDINIECHPANVSAVPETIYCGGVKLQSGMRPVVFKLTYDGMEISKTVLNVYDSLSKKHIGYRHYLSVNYNGEAADFSYAPTLKSEARDIISALVRTKRLKADLSDVLCDGMQIFSR